MSPLRRAFALPAVALALAPAVAGATVVERLSIDELTRRADLVVVATARRSAGLWVAGRIYTDVELAPEQVVRGDASLAAAGALIVRTPGGSVGNDGQNLAGAPRLEPGRRYVLFLRRTARGGLETVGLSQGALPVDAATGAVRPASTAGLEFRDPPAGAAPATVLVPPEGAPLTDLLGRLRALP